VDADVGQHPLDVVEAAEHRHGYARRALRNARTRGVARSHEPAINVTIRPSFTRGPAVARRMDTKKL
jgi:hypothetical protein